MSANDVWMCVCTVAAPSLFVLWRAEAANAKRWRRSCIEAMKAEAKAIR